MPLSHAEDPAIASASDSRTDVSGAGRSGIVSGEIALPGYVRGVEGMSYVLRRDESNRLLWVLGSLVSAKATTADTQGAFELLEYTAQEGDAAPVHTHPDSSESFYILEGEVTLFVGDDELQAPAGSFAFVSPGERHAFRVSSPTATFLQLMAGGGILPFFEEVGETAPSRTMPPPSSEPPDIDALVQAMERHGMQVLGPPPGME